MVSPLIGLAFTSAGFVLGSVSPSLHALGPIAERDRLVRMRFLIPVMVLLPIAGWLTDLWGPKDVAILGLLAVGLGCGLLAFAPMSNTNLLGLAVGVAFLAVGAISWMPTLLGSPGRTVQAMNLGFVGVGLGWLVGPSLTTQSFRWLGVRGTLLAGSAIALLSFLFLVNAETVDIAAVPRGDLSHIDLRFWLLIGALALYFPVESCIDVWSGPFLRDIGERKPGYLQSRIIGFWCAYLLARLAAFAILRTGSEPWFLLACAAASAMVLGNLVGAYGPSSGGFGFWIVGFCYGPLLPGILGMLMETCPEQFGVVLGVLLSLGCLYHTLVGPVLHRYVLSHTAREAMRMPVILTLVLVAPLLLATLLK